MSPALLAPFIDALHTTSLWSFFPDVLVFVLSATFPTLPRLTIFSPSSTIETHCLPILLSIAQALNLSKSRVRSLPSYQYEIRPIMLQTILSRPATLCLLRYHVSISFLIFYPLPQVFPPLQLYNVRSDASPPPHEELLHLDEHMRAIHPLGSFLAYFLPLVSPISCYC